MTIVAPTPMMAKAAGVGRHLDQRVGVEKVVDVRAADGIHVRAGGQREGNPQRDQHGNEPDLLRLEQRSAGAAKGRGPRKGGSHVV